jgi:replicative DNA helicase
VSASFPPPPDGPLDDGGSPTGPSGRRTGSANGSGRARGYDRVPPHSLEAEVSVLGAALLARAAANEAAEVLAPDDFYRNAHRVVFEGIRALLDSGEPIDTVTLTDWLARRDRLDEVGGPAALHDLTVATPTAANAAYYARIVRQKALLRRLIDAGTSVARLGYEATEDAEVVVDQAESLIYEVAQVGAKSEYAQLRDLLNESFAAIEKLAEQGSEVTGLATGFNDLDRLTSGLQPQNLVIVAARPAMGKCLVGTTRVNDVKAGGWTTIAELVARGRAGEAVQVAALDERGVLVPVDASEFHDNGVQPVWQLRTRSGRRITATANHPFRTWTGWTELRHLDAGTPIAVPRAVPFFGDHHLVEAEVELLADLLGDGAHDRSVPEEVFRLPREQLAVFLSRLLAADGSAWVAADDGWGISYRSVSERLIRDLQHLLLRFGILSRIRERQVRYLDDTDRAFELEIRDAADVRAFLTEIGILGEEEQCAKVLEHLERGSVVHTSTDRLPVEVWDLVRAEKGDRCWADVAEVTGRPRDHDWHVGERRPPRRLIAELAEALGSDALRRHASSDVLWDDVVAIEPAGEERVYDLTVPGLHNFVADDLIVHNSSLSLGIAQYVSVELRRPAIIFSLEMSKLEIVNRMLASEARIDSSKLRTGRLDDLDWRKLGDSLGKLSDAPLFIDDTPSITLMEIRAKCRRLKQRHDLDLIIVDYLQLMSSHARSDSRQQEVAEISRGLKMLAKELDVPVIALSQLSRQPESRTDKRPQLADLRESGSIEQDADIVGFIYRDEVYDEDSPDKGIAELIIAKHRNGATGVVKLAFLNHLTKFANLARGPSGASGGSGGAPTPM